MSEKSLMSYIPKPVRECFNIADQEFPVFMYFWCLALLAISITLIIYASFIKNSVVDVKNNIFPGPNENRFKSIHSCCYVIIGCGTVLLLQSLAILLTGKCMFVPFSANNYLGFFGTVVFFMLIIFITSLVMRSYLEDIVMEGKPDTTETPSPLATRPPPFKETNYRGKDDNQTYIFYMWIISMTTTVVAGLLGYAMYKITTNKEVEEKAKKQRAAMVDKHPELKTLDALISNGDYQVKVLETQIAEEDDTTVRMSLEKKKKDLESQIVTAKAEFDTKFKKLKGGVDSEEDPLQKQLKEIEKRRQEDLLKENQKRIEEAEEKKRQAIEQQRAAEQTRLTQERIALIEKEAADASLKAREMEMKALSISPAASPSPSVEKKTTELNQFNVSTELDKLKPIGNKIVKFLSDEETPPSKEELDQLTSKMTTIYNISNRGTKLSVSEKNVYDALNSGLNAFLNSPKFIESGRTTITQPIQVSYPSPPQSSSQVSRPASPPVQLSDGSQPLAVVSPPQSPSTQPQLLPRVSQPIQSFSQKQPLSAAFNP